MKSSFKKNIIKNLDSLNKILEDEKFNKLFDELVNISVNTLKNGGSIYIAGNGGSASQADHFAGELVGRFFIEGDSLKVFSPLTTNF